MSRIVPAIASACLLVMPGMVAPAHPRGLDANGCHDDTATGRHHCHRVPKSNGDARAPARKSRENVCHDRSSPNYKTIKYFASYPSLRACLTGSGRAFGH